MASRSERLVPADETADLHAAAPLDLSGLTGIVDYPLRRAQMAVFDDFARRFQTVGLSPAQYAAPIVIGDNPGRNQSEVPGALGIQRPNIVAMMDELERRGLAERTRSGADRRSNAVALTPAGRALLERAHIARTDQEAAIDSLLGCDARTALIAALSKLATL